MDEGKSCIDLTEENEFIKLPKFERSMISEKSIEDLTTGSTVMNKVMRFASFILSFCTSLK
jgi:hypothetical protein